MSRIECETVLLVQEKGIWKG